MACVGCGKQKAAERTEPQRAVRFRVALSGGEIFEGQGTEDWITLRDKCFAERRMVLAGKVYFNDGTSRNFGGWSWVYLIQEGENWTIDDDPSADRVLLKYRAPVLIPGGTVFESEMQSVNAAMNGD